MTNHTEQGGKAELKACPFCGGKSAFVPRAVNLALQKDPSNPTFGVSVICGKCGSESPNMVDEAHAADAWNRRIPLPQVSSPTSDGGREGAWSSVDRDGLPPCDGETVFVGINSAGFACCFNDARPDGLCLMGSPECSTAQMSELRWWRVLDRPSASASNTEQQEGSA